MAKELKSLMESTTHLEFQNLMKRGRDARQRGDRAAALAAFESALLANPLHIGVKIDLAFELRALERLVEAKEMFSRALKDAPDNAGAFTGLGHTLRKLGDRAGAVSAFKAAARIEPRNAGIKIDAANDLRELGQFEEAEVMFRSALTDEPENLSALIGLSRLLRQRGQRSTALAILETAARIKPNHTTVRTETAYLLRELGRHAEAEDNFRRILSTESANVDALVGLGYQLRDRGDRAGALVVFEAATAADPRNIAVIATIADLLRNLDRVEEAEAAFRRVLAEDKNHIGAMIGLGQIQKSRGNRESALATFAAATAAHPFNVGVKLHNAYLLCELGRLDEAEAIFLAALADEPGNANVLIGLGYLLVDLFRLDEAQAFFARALESDPKNIGCRLALGHLARRRGDRVNSQRYFESALDADPNNIHAKLEQAVELRDQGKFVEAKGIIESVIDSNSGHVPAYLQLGQVYRRQGERQAALKVFEKARDCQPKHVQTLLELATELRALGRPHEAEILLKKALDHEANHLGALTQYADHLIMAEDYEGALAIAHRAIELHPRKVWPYLHAARASNELGNNESVAKLLALATTMCGPQPEIAATRSQIFRQNRNFTAARRTLKNAPDQDNTNFFLWSEKVMLAINTGDYEVAHGALEHAPITSTKDQGRVFLFRAQLAEAQRKYEDAIAAYRESVRLDPTDSWSNGEMARASMILLDLDEARKHLRVSIELNTSANILRGQSLNVSQHHLGQILDEFLLDGDLVRQLKEVRTLSFAKQVVAFQELVKNYPDSTAPALLLVIAMRQTGLFSNAPPETGLLAPIPKRIIQFWDSADLPHDISTLISSWRSRHPNFEHTLFNDQSAKEFIKRNFPIAVLHAFMRARHPAQRADIFRLAYLSVNGGFYADADDRSLTSIETFVPSNAALMVYQENYGTLGNNFMGASPKHPVIVRALALATAAMNRGDNEILWLSTGPGLLTRAFAQIVSGVQSTANWKDGTVVRELGEMQQVIGFHCPVHYKRTEKHWSRAATRKK